MGKRSNSRTGAARATTVATTATAKVAQTIIRSLAIRSTNWSYSSTSSRTIIDLENCQSLQTPQLLCGEPCAIGLHENVPSHIVPLVECKYVDRTIIASFVPNGFWRLVWSLCRTFVQPFELRSFVSSVSCQRCAVDQDRSRKETCIHHPFHEQGF